MRTRESYNLRSLSSQDKTLKFWCKCEIRNIQSSLFSFTQLLEKMVLYTLRKVESFRPCMLLRYAGSHLKYFFTGVISAFHGLLSWFLLNLERKHEENPRLIFQIYKVHALQAAIYTFFSIARRISFISYLFQINILHRKFNLILQNYIH